MRDALSIEVLKALRRLDTCTVSNAIESFEVRLRNEGFTDASIKCLFPELGIMAGHAVTVRMRCSSPSPVARPYHDRTDWWEHVQSVPAPRVVVIEDLDSQRGLGSFIGEVHASILRALECVGVVTNGSVRDLPATRAAGFHLFASSVAVSHAYAHIVDFGQPVRVGGLMVRPGELLLGDIHGVLSVPGPVAERIPAAAARQLARERRVIELCRSSQFSVERLCALIRETA